MYVTIYFLLIILTVTWIYGPLCNNLWSPPYPQGYAALRSGINVIEDSFTFGIFEVRYVLKFGCPFSLLQCYKLYNHTRKQSL